MSAARNLAADLGIPPMVQAKDVELAVTVPLPKEGPVHDVKWTPAGDYFVVVAGESSVNTLWQGFLRTVLLYVLKLARPLDRMCPVSSVYWLLISGCAAFTKVQALGFPARKILIDHFRPTEISHFFEPPWPCHPPTVDADGPYIVHRARVYPGLQETVLVALFRVSVFSGSGRNVLRKHIWTATTHPCSV